MPLALIFLILSSCTITINLADNYGEAKELIEEKIAPDNTVSPTINLPL